MRRNVVTDRIYSLLTILNLSRPRASRILSRTWAYSIFKENCNQVEWRFVDTLALEICAVLFGCHTSGVDGEL